MAKTILNNICVRITQKANNTSFKTSFERIVSALEQDIPGPDFVQEIRSH